MSKRLMAREIREMLQGKVDPKVSFVLEALAEQQSVQRQNLMTMAQTVDQVITQLAMLQEVIGKAKDRLERATTQQRMIEGSDDDLPPVSN